MAPAPLPKSDPFIDHLLELLAPAAAGAPLKARRMFGGWGISWDGLSIAIVAEGRLYLKTDVENRAALAQAGCEPFVYDAERKLMQMSYWTVPADAMDAPHLMTPWARKAIEAALRAANAKPATKKTTAKKPAPRKRSGLA